MSIKNNISLVSIKNDMYTRGTIIIYYTFDHHSVNSLFLLLGELCTFAWVLSLLVGILITFKKENYHAYCVM